MTDRRAVVFDMDGTLLWLDVDIAAVRGELSALFAPSGFRDPFRPVLQRIDEAAQLAGCDDAERARWRLRGRAVIDAAEVDAARSARPATGAVDALAALAALDDGGDVALGLVTDNGAACVHPALAAAGLPAVSFGTVITRDDLTMGKPSPVPSGRLVTNG